MVLGLQLCIAEAEVPAGGAGEAGKQSICSEMDQEGYDLVTYQHRRGIEADYHAVGCLDNQPQVSSITYYTYLTLSPSPGGDIVIRLVCLLVGSFVGFSKSEFHEIWHLCQNFTIVF